MRTLLFVFVLVLVLLVPASFPAMGAAQGETEGPLPEDLPLLRWELLRATHYAWGGNVEWAQGLTGFDGARVRLEGYLMSNFSAQDKGDLLLAAIHPLNLACGPTDMTAVIQVHLPGFDPEEWPQLPVAVWGRFSLSPRPGNLMAIYRLRAEGWRTLRRWEQDFPGIVEDPLGAEDDQ